MLDAPGGGFLSSFRLVLERGARHRPSQAPLPPFINDRRPDIESFYIKYFENNFILSVSEQRLPTFDSFTRAGMQVFDGPMPISRPDL
jgi:hypothetical protein